MAPAPQFVHALSCAEGSTGEKRLTTADDFCSALRSETLCPDAAGFFALLQGCP